MSSVMPRSCPTTMPLVITSTSHPRSASTSATDVAWWKPISSDHHDALAPAAGPPWGADPSSTSRTSATRSASPGTHHGRLGSAPVATITWSGFFLLDQTRPHADAVLDGDAEARTLPPTGCGSCRRTRPVRHARGDPHLPACDGLLLVHRHPMTRPRCGDRGLQTRRPRPDDHHVPDGGARSRGRSLRRCGRTGRRPQRRACRRAWRTRPRGRSSGSRCSRASVQAHTADALLVARETQAHLVRGACAGLQGEVRVGDLATHDADQVTVTLRQCPLGLQRVLERPTPTTGSSTALRIALGMNIA